VLLSAHGVLRPGLRAPPNGLGSRYPRGVALIPLYDFRFDGRVHHLMTQIIRHDMSFYRHSMLVASLMGSFARYLGFSPKDISHLQIAAVLHDIGKLSIPSRVLTKVGPLEQDEQIFIFAHPDEGRRILQAIGISDSLILSVAQEHHERLDGSGYPRALTAPFISERFA